MSTTITRIPLKRTSAGIPRRPRFRRDELRTNVQITERDIVILQHIHEHRFLRSTHLVTLVEGSEQRIVRRLGDLFAGGFVDRPPAQLDYYHRGGSDPVVYALGDEGARVLIERGSIADPGRLYFSRRNLEATRPALLHTLEVADFSVALLAACRPTSMSLAIPRLDRAHQFITTVPTDAKTKHGAFKWSVKVRNPRARQDQVSAPVSVIPDHVFRLTLDAQTPRPTALNFVVEIDRSTMPLTRMSLTQSSILKKLLAYSAANAERLDYEHFRWSGFNVLIVTDTKKRVDNILDLIKSTPGVERKLFMVIDRPTLYAAPNILGVPFHKADGSTRRLIDNPTIRLAR